MEQEYKHKACPFRQNHYCPNCELLIPIIDMCVFKCMNANMGLLAKTLAKDVKAMDKIQKEALKEQ